MPAQTVLIVDDSAILINAVVMQISAHTDLVSIGRESLLAIPRRLTGLPAPSIAIINPSQSDRTPADLRDYYIEQLGAEAFIAYLPAHEQELAQDCLGAAYSAILSRGNSAEALISAVMTVQVGGIYVDGCFQAFADAPDQTEIGGMSGLTKREKTVLTEVTLGHSSKEIAQQLNISPKTVETHRYRAMNKLGLAGRSSLLAHARKHHW